MYPQPGPCCDVHSKFRPAGSCNVWLLCRWFPPAGTFPDPTRREPRRSVRRSAGGHRGSGITGDRVPQTRRVLRSTGTIKRHRRSAVRRVSAHLAFAASASASAGAICSARSCIISSPVRTREGQPGRPDLVLPHGSWVEVRGSMPRAIIHPLIIIQWGE
jgi:hypothetical protein